jgi:hypothetical protein
MRTPYAGPNPRFKKKRNEEPGEYYKELMKQTIVPQWELAKKAKEEEEE